jgi:hypothetical protein
MKNSVSKNNIVQDKKTFKKSAGKCRICDNDNYSTLSVHRIKPGCEGGKYTEMNVVVCCENCHRRIHNKEIEIDRYYDSTGGTLLRIVEDGKEKFV